jgi:hypothetical protein
VGVGDVTEVLVEEGLLLFDVVVVLLGLLCSPEQPEIERVTAKISPAEAIDLAL